MWKEDRYEEYERNAGLSVLSAYRSYTYLEEQRY